MKKPTQNKIRLWGASLLLSLGGLASGDDSFRQQPPPAGPPKPLKLPEAEQFTLKNGLEVTFLRDDTLPVISLDLVFPGGRASNGTQHTGRAEVCMKFFTRGNGQLDFTAFKNRGELLGAKITSFASADFHGYTLAGLSSQRDPSLQLFLDTVTRPLKDKEEWQRLIKREVNSLKQSVSSPRGVVRRLARQVLYGKDHPLGELIQQESLENLKMSDCQKFHRQYIGAQGARLYVTGKINQSQIRKYFSRLSGKVAATKNLPQGKPTKAGKVYFVQFPGAAQSSLAILGQGPKRSAADHNAFKISMRVLGQGLTSRISTNLRSKRGYTYGAFAYVNYHPRGSFFYAGTSVRSDVSYAALLQLQKEINSISDQSIPITQSEFERERTGSLLGLPGQFRTSRKIVDNLRSLTELGMPIDHYAGEVARLQQLDLGAAQKAAQAHLNLSQYDYLVVGDGNQKMHDRSSEDAKDEPLEVDGKPLTLKQALKLLGREVIYLDPHGKRLASI